MKISQELVDAIVCEVDDICSLKACALAGSVFRGRSQRILLQSLTLDALPKVSGILTLLEESPHIAAYITGLKIEILNRLTNVRRFHVRVPLSHSLLGPTRFFRATAVVQATGHLPSARSPAIAFFSNVALESPVASSSDAASKVEELVLDDWSTYQLISRPQFESQLQKLCRLSIVSSKHGSTLLSSTACTLEHVNLRVPSHSRDRLLPHIPPLLLLRSVTFSLSFSDHHRLDFLAEGLAAVRASPRLAYVVLVFERLSREECQQTLYLSVPTLLYLDAKLAEHPARPSIRWCLDFESSVDERVRAEKFKGIGEAVRAEMPMAREEGRLVVEMYRPQKESNPWVYNIQTPFGYETLGLRPEGWPEWHF
ncbi:hypothetical protein DFH06DRAFT_1207352 [Mycena polygramma]|nr:hypothetical protein DFH06DRAFT_1207352 [Mycena polygramma]